MTLHQLQWTIFDVDPAPQTESFVKKIKDHMSPEAPTTSVTSSIDTSALIMKRGGRLNTKLKQQSTLGGLGTSTSPTQINNFWDRNFPSDSEVPWYKFQKCFLSDYETKLSGMAQNIACLNELVFCLCVIQISSMRRTSHGCWRCWSKTFLKVLTKWPRSNSC